MEWLVAESAAVVKVAWPLASRALVARAVAPSLKVTVPVGEQGPGGLGATDVGVRAGAGGVLGGESVRAILEADCAGRRARPGEIGRHRRGGEGDGLANDGWVGRGDQRGGSAELVDDLGEDQGIGAGLEAGIVVVDGRDRVGADLQTVGGEGGG